MKKQDELTLFFCGDVMTGRGVDQILIHPSHPDLHEGYLQSALDYVRLAEERYGPISRPVPDSYIWGDSLSDFQLLKPQVRIVNLETSVTTSNEWEDKGINYRMHPDNISVLKAAGIDLCILANNHTLDWGRAGLVETLQALHGAAIEVIGAGLNQEQAQRPAIFELQGGGRLLVFAGASLTSGVPEHWRALSETAGVNLLMDLSEESLKQVAQNIQRWKRQKDRVLFSIHWGDNWGYEAAKEQRWFAHALIDRAGVDLVYGHSAHHVKGLELHRNKLIVYGCGDFINDYEGIRGHEKYRGDLSLMFFPSLDEDGTLLRLVVVPLQIRKLQLHHASLHDKYWLLQTLNRESRGLAGGLQINDQGFLVYPGSSKVFSEMET